MFKLLIVCVVALFTSELLAEINCSKFYNMELGRAGLGTLDKPVSKCIEINKDGSTKTYKRTKDCADSKNTGYEMPDNTQYQAAAVRFSAQERKLETFFSIGKTHSNDDNEENLNYLPTHTFWLDEDCKIYQVQFDKDKEKYSVESCKKLSGLVLQPKSTDSKTLSDAANCRDLIINYSDFLLDKEEGRRYKNIINTNKAN